METADYLRILKDEIHSTVFATTDGNGLPVTRVIDIMLVDNNSLSLGGNDMITIKTGGFYVTERCKKCEKCFEVCPQNCIVLSEGKALINQEHCLHCGGCYEICPQKAILKRG